MPYRRRTFMSKRRRTMPRRIKLKILRYASSPMIRYARRTSGVTMGSRKMNAARYGLFYDMMRKYAATRAIGRPSIAQKTMNMVVSRKNNILSTRQMKENNFRVSRFCLISYSNSGLYANPATYTDTNLSLPGFYPAMIMLQRNFPYQGNAFTSTYDLATIQSISPSTTQCGHITIHPTWPGSKLHNWDSPAQGNPSTQPKWGLIPGNQIVSNRNYNFNTRAVANVFAFQTSAAPTVDNLEILYRSIKVYRSTLTLEFFNTSCNREVDVHIVHFKYLDFDTTNQAGTCGAATNDFNLFHNLLAAEQAGDTSTFFAQNNAQLAWEYCIQHKKLPQRNYITKSWKTITLGRAIDTREVVRDVGNVIHVNRPVASTNRPYRKITFKYGTKIWTRTGCIEEGSFIDDQTLDDRRKLDTQVMIFTTPNKNYLMDSTVGPTPTQASWQYIATCVQFRFWKTNMWREQS